MNANLAIEHGYVVGKANRLRGTNIYLGGPSGSSVLATANVMMAAVLAEGVTTIQSAACEPEVVDLANCLRAMGAKISGDGTDTITITGVEKLHGASHRIMPDRIETGTYLCAACNLPLFVMGGLFLVGAVCWGLINPRKKIFD